MDSAHEISHALCGFPEIDVERSHDGCRAAINSLQDIYHAEI